MEIVPLPSLLQSRHLEGVVVVFDVIRATTSMATALANGASEVRVYGSGEMAMAGRDQADLPAEQKVLAGETNALRPGGFDLGNSPGGFTADAVVGRTVFMATTNGTKALVAAAGAKVLLAAAIVNAAATRAYLLELGLPVTLLCAGTNGEPAPEDELGARLVRGDEVSQAEIDRVLRESPGGQNVMRVGLGDDLIDCARRDTLDVVAQAKDGVLRRVLRQC